MCWLLMCTLKLAGQKWFENSVQGRYQNRKLTGKNTGPWNAELHVLMQAMEVCLIFILYYVILATKTVLKEGNLEAVKEITQSARRDFVEILSEVLRSGFKITQEANRKRALMVAEW